jgi:hypothetical protein
MKQLGFTFTVWRHKEFERATMRASGVARLRPDTLLAMHPTGETISPRSKPQTITILAADPQVLIA